MAQLAQAIENPDFTGAESQALVTLYLNFGQLHNISKHKSWLAPETITFADMNKFQQLYLQHPLFDIVTARPGSLFFNVIDSLKHLPQDPEVNRQLYVKSDSTNRNTISHTDVQQGGTGDCYFAAPLASLALVDPEVIKNSIQDNHDGTYTVTFAGAKDTPVTVTTPTDTELTLYNHGSANGIWASVIEKAFGKYAQEQAIQKSRTLLLMEGLGGTPMSVPVENWEIQPFQHTIGRNGGDPATAIKLLTGHDAITVPTNNLRDSNLIIQSLKANFANDPTRPQKIIIAVTPATPTELTEDGFRSNHAYSVMSFTPKGDGADARISLRNPENESLEGSNLDIVFNNFGWFVFEQ